MKLNSLAKLQIHRLRKKKIVFHNQNQAQSQLVSRTQPQLVSRCQPQLVSRYLSR